MNAGASSAAVNLEVVGGKAAACAGPLWQQPLHWQAARLVIRPRQTEGIQAGEKCDSY